AEALGATYHGRTPGTFGRAGIFSFNGNKIITTSGGGMLVSDDAGLVARARKLATQARDAAVHYEHTEIGYNYRMSNVLAGIGRGQLRFLEERVKARRRNFEVYRRALGHLPGLEFMPEAPWGRHTRWLTTLTIDPALFGVDREGLRQALEAENIEARPVWKPMHLQPVFAAYPSVGGAVAEDLFQRGLCLPSGSNLSRADLERVVEAVRRVHEQARPSGVRAPRAWAAGAPPRPAAAPLSPAAPAAVAPALPVLAAPRLNPLVVRLRRPGILAAQALLVALSFVAAFLLRFDGNVPGFYMDVMLRALPVVLAARLLSFLPFGLYKGWWRHAGVDDLVAVIKSVSVGSGVMLGALVLAGGVEDLPRSILVLDWGICIALLGGSRLLARAGRDGWMARRWRHGASKRTLVVGAGDAAERLLRELQRGGFEKLRPVGIVDDDPAKRGMQLRGVPVLGASDAIPKLVARHRVEVIVIAVPSATRDEMQRLVDACVHAQVEFRIAPSLRELLEGRVHAGAVRKLEVEDLLGRKPVTLDTAGVRGELQGRTVLITGGAGSIGSELVRQVAALGPRRLVLLDRAESPLSFVHLDLARRYPELELVPLVGDVTDAARMEQVFLEQRPEVVFHAAAYKHVRLMQHNVVEAARNNVLGTVNAAECAARHGAARFILVSTDGAGHPTSVVGATKRLAERIVLGWPALAGARTDFRVVRFGNVLGSDGSVVSVFRRQLAAGGPLTVTHPEVTRYFMSIEEAVHLVLRAGTIPDAAGRIALLDMGEPVRILELAENLVRLSGLEPYDDIPIVFSGLRPGETLHEEFSATPAGARPTRAAKVRVIDSGGEPDPAAFSSGMDRLAAAVALRSAADTLYALLALVPDSAPAFREMVRNVALGTGRMVEPLRIVSGKHGSERDGDGA
ncbi:MAG: polysaccharide biosynthesis protein, partial [Gemmatimonadetes bacterium]|nr:polysaccharide biosynthesis protein [Gemmatimonadota bacterium]